MRDHFRRRLGVLLLAPMLTAACGTTVPLASSGEQGPDVIGEFGADPAGELPGDPLGDGWGDAGPRDADPLAPVGAGGPAGDGLVPDGPSGGADADGPSDGVPPGAPGGRPGPGDRPSANTSPLKIGIAYLDNSSTESQFDVETDTSINGKRAAQAIVAGINAAGGLNGRELKPVEYSWDTSGTNYSQDATTACEKFTKDNRVEVVLDSAFGTIGGFADCLQRAGVLHITGAAEGDRISSKARPLHANPRSMVDDRSYAAVLKDLAATDT